MTNTAKEWFEKAEADYRTAEREFVAAESPNFDAVCFHSQQCVEKLMKGLLIDRGVVPPRTHDLVELERLLAAKPGWLNIQDLRFLSRASVIYRYPGESADRAEAKEALEACARLRTELLSGGAGG